MSASNGNGFQDAIERHLAAKNDPVAQVRLQLAPLRARAVEYLMRFREVSSRHTAAIEAAMVKHNDALAIGIRVTGLREALTTAIQFLRYGGGGFDECIRTIDNLTTYQIGQRAFIGEIEPRLNLTVPSIGEIERLSGVVASLLRELEEKVKTTAPNPPPPLTDGGGSMPSPSRTIVTEFDPRMRL